MKVFTYSEARRRLSAVLDSARKEEVLITRRGGDTFRLSMTESPRSPFDVPGVRTRVTTRDILAAVEESRGKSPRSGSSKRG